MSNEQEWEQQPNAWKSEDWRKIGKIQEVRVYVDVYLMCGVVYEGFDPPANEGWITVCVGELTKAEVQRGRAFQKAEAILKERYPHCTHDIERVFYHRGDADE